MDISMDIHETSVDVDMDMDVIFHIHGNPGHSTFFSQNCHIPTRFGTPACQMKVILPIFPKIGCHGNVP